MHDNDDATDAYRSTSQTETDRAASGDTAYHDRQQSSDDRCPDCHARVYISEDEETVCPDCGIVINDEPLSRKPARTFGNSDWRSKRRTGGRVTSQYADGGIGSSVPQELVTRSWQTERTSSDTRLDYALGEIRRLAGYFEVGRFEREAATKLYRQAMDNDCIVGRNIDAFAPACLLIAIRQSDAQIPVSKSELAPISKASKNEIHHARRALEQELDISVPVISAVDFLARVRSAFDLSYHIEERVKQLLRAATVNGDLEHHSYSPRAVIGAAVHHSCDIEDVDGPTLQELADELDVGKCTISKRKNIFRPHTDE